MNLFYLGLNPRYQSFSFLPEGLNVMLSAAGYWNGKDWRHTKYWPKQTGSRWLDSGGFTLLNRFGDYPFNLEEYLELVIWIQPHYYASMDYPCEPEITRLLSLMSNRERIERTVENMSKMMKWEGNSGSQLVPVIQGYSLEEYLYCIELYRKEGLIRDYMAVGSMCRRISNEELHKLIPTIHEASRDAGCQRLHYFGLKLSPHLIDLAPYIYSRDSAAALDSYDKELRAKRGGRRWPRGQEEKREAFESFLKRLDKLNLNYITLEEK